MWYLRLSKNLDRIVRWAVMAIGLLIITYPLLGVIYSGYLYVWATSHGCRISARGPEPCIIDGVDYTATVSGLSGIGFGFVFAIGWAIAATILLLLWRSVMRRFASR